MDAIVQFLTDARIWKGREGCCGVSACSEAGRCGRCLVQHLHRTSNVSARRSCLPVSVPLPRVRSLRHRLRPSCATSLKTLLAKRERIAAATSSAQFVATGLSESVGNVWWFAAGVAKSLALQRLFDRHDL